MSQQQLVFRAAAAVSADSARQNAASVVSATEIAAMIEGEMRATGRSSPTYAEVVMSGLSASPAPKAREEPKEDNEEEEEEEEEEEIDVVTVDDDRPEAISDDANGARARDPDATPTAPDATPTAPDATPTAPDSTDDSNILRRLLESGHGWVAERPPRLDPPPPAPSTAPLPPPPYGARPSSIEMEAAEAFSHLRHIIKDSIVEVLAHIISSRLNLLGPSQITDIMRRIRQGAGTGIFPEERGLLAHV